MRKNKIVFATSFLACIAFAITMNIHCKNPMTNISYAINTNIFKYTADIKVIDMTTGSIPANVQITISGKDANSVYDIAGRRDFILHDGKLEFAINPALEPTTANPIEFDIDLSTDGYLPTSTHIIISKNQFVQKQLIKMLNYANPPGNLAIKTQVYSLTDGYIKNHAILKFSKTSSTDSVYFDDGLTSVVLPDSTEFYYYKDSLATTIATRRVYLPYTVLLDTTSKAEGYSETAIAQPHDNNYYTTESIQITNRYLVKAKYTGADIRVICLYSTGTDISLGYSSNETAIGPQINLLDGSTANSDKLLYATAVQKKLVDIYFIGKVNGKNITISPKQNKRWFTSFVINPTIINPITHTAVQAGDSIEVGIDYNTNTTKREVISSVNGQLRVESQSTDMGYYYAAPYEYPFHFTFNDYLDSSQLYIPDVENLWARWTLKLSLSPYAFFSKSFDPQSGQNSSNDMIGRWYSKTPITIDSANIAVWYWGKELKYQNTTGSGWYGNYNIYTPPYLFTLQPAVDFTLMLVCSEKKIMPNFHGAIYSSVDNFYFYCNLNNGRWKTRGVQQGKTYSINGEGCGYKFAYNRTISGTSYVDSLTTPALCNCFWKN
ncbi:MAG: hypothetical protein WCG87_10345 [Bacteroidota bacterium]